jgi:hypothetical protein
MKVIVEHAFGTSFETSGPWNIPTACTAFCPDGKVRKLKRVSVNSKFVNKINGSINFNGLTVSGDVTIVNFEGMSDDEKSAQMIHFKPTGVNANVFERKAELQSNEK